MERTVLHDPARSGADSTPRSNPAATQPGSKRLRGVIVDINETDGGGYIRLASRQFRFRAIDLVGSRRPNAGESASFTLSSDDQGYRASQIVLDSDPQFIRGQSSLQDCYRAHAKTRAARIARQKTTVAEPVSQLQGVEYRRCYRCQRMVLPKRQRGKATSTTSAPRWHESCPHCKQSLDGPNQARHWHPLPVAMLLGAACAWLLL